MEPHLLKLESLKHGFKINSWVCVSVIGWKASISVSNRQLSLHKGLGTFLIIIFPSNTEIIQFLHSWLINLLIMHGSETEACLFQPWLQILLEIFQILLAFSSVVWDGQSLHSLWVFYWFNCVRLAQSSPGNQAQIVFEPRSVSELAQVSETEMG